MYLCNRICWYETIVTKSCDSCCSLWHEGSLSKSLLLPYKEWRGLGPAWERPLKGKAQGLITQEGKQGLAEIIGQPGRWDKDKKCKVQHDMRRETFITRIYWDHDFAVHTKMAKIILIRQSIYYYLISKPLTNAVKENDPPGITETTVSPIALAVLVSALVELTS